MSPARPHARTPGRLLLALALTLVLGACAGPAPPAPGTPGLDLRTPLPYTPVPLPPTAPPAALPTATPLPAASPVSGTPGPAPTADTALPRLVITNTAGTPVALYVELAITPDQQETGLMHRTAMAEDQGMLFVFPSETTVPFWMKDTLLPLSIAFIDSRLRIIDLQDMQPLDLSLHEPAGPYVDALEVNQGYFRRHGIAIGNTVQLPPSVPTPVTSPLPDGSP